jgi:4-hydroxy-2-oxoheptanedioate aldolase
MNPLRRRIEAGEPVLAVNLGGYAPPLVDVIARHGAGCLFIDCERTAIAVGDVPVLVRLARAAGLASVVRSESADAPILLRYLDCGVDGLVVPQVEAPETLDRMRAVARQATKGRPEEVFLIPQIESVTGEERLLAIAGHPSADLVLIGPNDLAHSMGFAGDTSRPELKSAVDRIADGIRGQLKPFGLPVSQETVRDWVGRGARLLYTNLEQFLAPSMNAFSRALA